MHCYFNTEWTLVLIWDLVQMIKLLIIYIKFWIVWSNRLKKLFFIIRYNVYVTPHLIKYVKLKECHDKDKIKRGLGSTPYNPWHTTMPKRN